MSISAVVPFLSKLLQNLHASLFIYIHTQTNTLDPCARHMHDYIFTQEQLCVVCQWSVASWRTSRACDWKADAWTCLAAQGLRRPCSLGMKTKEKDKRKELAKGSRKVMWAYPKLKSHILLFWPLMTKKLYTLIYELGWCYYIHH
jgi:hypothetical protein